MADINSTEIITIKELVVIPCGNSYALYASHSAASVLENSPSQNHSLCFWNH